MRGFSFSSKPVYTNSVYMFNRVQGHKAFQCIFMTLLFMALVAYLCFTVTLFSCVFSSVKKAPCVKLSPKRSFYLSLHELRKKK